MHDLEHLSAEEVLAEAVERFHPRLAVACSFQKEASVILDMLAAIEPSTRFFTLDTGLHFEETYETWRAVEEHYGIDIEGVTPITLRRQAALHGDELWRNDPDRCCTLRKVRPLRDVLAGRDAWVTGLRREQSRERADTPKLHWDAKHDLWKLNPLADWTERDVWRYIADHDVPYHPLHDRGFGSIGCAPCTRAGDGREGRWAGTDKVECGLHLA
jgi:phosphoadenosine phosphosulfate reductase